MPEHIITLIAVLVVGWILFRWGDLLLLAYAFFHFCNEQWTNAVLALIYAAFVLIIKTIVMGLMRWRSFYRGKWL